MLRVLGVAAVVASSFAGLFCRNASNLGLMALACAEVGRISAGDRLVVDGVAGRIDNLTSGETIHRLRAQSAAPHGAGARRRPCCAPRA